MHPFLALVAGSALTGFAAGVGGQDVISDFEDAGRGDLVGNRFGDRGDDDRRGQTFKTWSIMETLISVVGFGFVSISWVIV